MGSVVVFVRILFATDETGIIPAQLSIVLLLYVYVIYPYEPPLMGYDLFKLKIIQEKTNKLPRLCTHFFHFQASIGLIQMEDVQRTLFRQSASSLKEDKHVFIQSNSRLTVYDPIFFACRCSLFRVILKSKKQYMTIGNRKH